MNTSNSDGTILLLAGISSAIVYGALSIIAPRSQLPVLAAVFVGSNMFSRTGMFQRFVRTIYERHWQRKNTSRFLLDDSDSPNRSRFLALQDTSKVELLSAVKSLDAYSENSRKSNTRRKNLFKLLSWRQQRLCEDAGYMDKLKSIDRHIDLNQTALDGIVKSTKSGYGLSYKDFEWLNTQKTVQSTSTTNYRVVEALGHFVRDWSPVGHEEVDAIHNYVKSQLDKVIPEGEEQSTCVVIPGSGLGRVAHEVSTHRNFGAVHAVEFSGLMHACNEYAYDNDKVESEKKGKSPTIYPYVHTCSNFADTDSQFRAVSIETPGSRPGNLFTHLDDFRFFDIPDASKYSNVVVVSVFFIDTAENLIDYLDVISRITAPSTRTGLPANGYWINVGPLKYGTAAQVELNTAEIRKIRRKLGWKDLHEVETIKDPNSPGGPGGVLGYITDKQSMWQGYYGVNMWTSGQSKNRRR